MENYLMRVLWQDRKSMLGAKNKNYQKVWLNKFHILDVSICKWLNIKYNIHLIKWKIHWIWDQVVSWLPKNLGWLVVVFGGGGDGWLGARGARSPCGGCWVLPLQHSTCGTKIHPRPSIPPTSHPCHYIAIKVKNSTTQEMVVQTPGHRILPPLLPLW